MSALLEPTAVQVDASWYRNPQTSGVRVYHMLRPGTSNSDERVACGKHALFHGHTPARMIDHAIRCQRNGCKRAWAKIGGAS